jgi:hypothetical protein
MLAPFVETGWRGVRGERLCQQRCGAKAHAKARAE